MALTHRPRCSSASLAAMHSAAPAINTGWIGVECASVRAAIWMMRALVVSNVLSRREGTTLFVPVNPTADPDGARVSGLLARIGHLAAVDGMT